MKPISKLLLFLLLLSGYSALFAQRPADQIAGRVNYRWHSDTAKMDDIFSRLREKDPEKYAMFGADLERSEEIIRRLEFELNFTSTAATWGIVEDAASLSEHNGSPYGMAKSRAGGNKVHYVNLAERERLYETELGQAGGGVVHIRTPFDKFDWQLTGRTKRIGKYACREATVTFTEGTRDGEPMVRTHIAWFTPQIPYPFGPAGIDGLPGLILELYFNEEAISGYRAQEISIDQVHNPSLPKLQRPVKVMTQDELDGVAEDRINRIKGN